MKSKRIYIPEYIRALIFFMCVGMFVLGFTKSIFLITNFHSFPNIRLLDILGALWIDAVTVSLTFIPFAVFWLLPVTFRQNRWYKIGFRVLFLLNMAFLAAANLLDVVYYGYAGKRSTFDLFSVLGYEQEMGNHWVTYAKDFWWLALILLVLLVFCNRIFSWIYKRIISGKESVSALRYGVSTALVITVLVLVARGGLGLRPISIISISQYSSPENVGFVSNTAFTMLKSFEEPGLDRLKLLQEKEAFAQFTPIRQYDTQPFENFGDSLNVVVVILESFGSEWLGNSKENQSFTPFFDSLCAEGYYFPNAYANGTKSIEAMPAVLASIPTLMETPYIASRYASNKLDGLGFMLKENGYSSAFFHGAAKGSMNFDGFAALIGLDLYFGKRDYPDMTDFDGTWGIFDHKFLPWSAQKMTEMTEPFFNAIFTLSSHHPYVIPNHLEGKLMEGPYPICKSLNYGDYALREFFNEAKKQPWFNRTLFVFVADHTSSSKSSYYGQKVGMFSVPVLYYMANGALPKKSNPEITQQIDILPSILHLIGYDKPIYAFGQSVFQRDYPPFAITYTEGVHNLFFDRYLLTFSGHSSFNLFDLDKDPRLTQNIFPEKQSEIQAMSLFLQALIQRFNNDLLDNRNHAAAKN
jgi:phosphoglycerol transferase MdoB-like AlkP superfamily enzyme